MVNVKYLSVSKAETVQEVRCNFNSELKLTNRDEMKWYSTICSVCQFYVHLSAEWQVLPPTTCTIIVIISPCLTLVTATLITNNQTEYTVTRPRHVHAPYHTSTFNVPEITAQKWRHVSTVMTYKIKLSVTAVWSVATGRAKVQTVERLVH